MKKLLLSSALLLAAVSVHAQQDFFALTGQDSPNIIFKDFRALDLSRNSSGEVFLSTESQPQIYSAVQKRNVADDKSGYGGAQAQGMATLAYDANGGNLIYMPMFSGNVYVLNNSTKALTLIENQAAKVVPCDINSHITRMTAGYDGSIYAMSNSGSQFLKISFSNGNYSVTDLGAVSDDSSNGANSIKSIPTGFGGDMVADADNNFYIFSASGNVFKVNSGSLSAKFLGKINGLPENYSLNGAAVNSENKVVVGTAKGGSLYEVNMENLQAKSLENGLNLHIYDLASKYFLNDSKLVSHGITGIDVYPTRVDQKFVNVRIADKNVKGAVNVEVFDIAGARIKRQSVSADSTSKIDLNNLHSGVYLINVTDSTGTVLLTKKVMVTN